MTEQTPNAGQPLDELQQIMAAVREDLLSDAQRRRLEALLVDDESMKVYIRYASLSADLHQRLGEGAISSVKPERAMSLYGDLLDLSEDETADQTSQQGQLSEAIFGKPVDIPSAEDQTETEAIVAPSWQPPFAHQESRWRFARTFGSGLAVAAVLLGIGLWTFWPRSHISPPVATLTALVDPAFEGAGTADLTVGAPLEKGKSIRLTRGFVQITCKSGAQVILQGPAQATFDGDNRVALDWGRLTGNVTEAAHGFTVVTPLGNVVDLGTEFGVDVSPDQVVNVVVFRGSVKASTAGAPDNAQTLVAGEAARINPTEVVRESSENVPLFARDIQQIRRPFAVFASGQELAADKTDLHWVVTKDTPGAKTEKAVLLDPINPDNVANTDQTKWITGPNKGGLYASQWYRFEVNFDLAGFDPATAKVALRVTANDYVAYVTLNGKFNPHIPRGPQQSSSRTLNLQLDQGFVPGKNRLSILVHNVKDNTPMALWASLSGDAVRLTNQSTDQNAAQSP